MKSKAISFSAKNNGRANAHASAANGFSKSQASQFLDAKCAKEALSPLEYQVACVLWNCQSEKLKVRDIQARVKKSSPKKVPLTSVAVILDRLFDKGVVTRNAEAGRGGYHYYYSATASREDFERTLLEKAVDGILEKFGSNAVSYFNERFSSK